VYFIVILFQLEEELAVEEEEDDNEAQGPSVSAVGS
jgi:hypothetical protein